MDLDTVNEEDKDRICLKRRTLTHVLEQCKKALDLLNIEEGGGIDDDEGDGGAQSLEDLSREGSSLQFGDKTANEFRDLLKSRVECPGFLEKLKQAQSYVLPNAVGVLDIEEGSSWDVISENDLWEGKNGSYEDDYVLVRQEDVVEGITCFMAAYLLSLDQTKELTPNQLQEALSKTFSMKKKKGKLRKAWDGSIVIYNVASWGATAVGIYQNPIILTAASKAFWTSCHIISKLI